MEKDCSSNPGLQIRLHCLCRNCEIEDTEHAALPGTLGERSVESTRRNWPRGKQREKREQAIASAETALEEAKRTHETKIEGIKDVRSTFTNYHGRRMPVGKNREVNWKRL